MYRSNVLQISAILLLTAGPCLAYVDPGTAGILFQMGYVVISSMIAGLAFFFRPIKSLFLRITGRARATEVSLEAEDDEPEDQGS